ncbi:MAG: GntR family transcriptional regulator [Clostridiaceae bacterium]|nr:GntR family transcriptional regulator [Clostridiaceae bacterium]
MIDFTRLNLNNKEPVYVQIASFVKKQILAGSAKSGEELPSRRELAALLGINPNTVQKAYRLMEEEGYVRTLSNSGSIIYTDEKILSAVGNEFTKELVAHFVKAAKDINMTFKQTIDLISEVWDEI